MTERYLFILALVLIAVAYFVGAATDIATLTTGLKTIGLTFTGRNANGQFASYPQGATLHTAA